MLGAIAGDIAGSPYEGSGIKDKGFQPLLPPWGAFTDDSVLTVAVADCLLNGRSPVATFKDWGRRSQPRDPGLRTAAAAAAVAGAGVFPSPADGAGLPSRVRPTGSLGHRCDTVPTALRRARQLLRHGFLYFA